MVINLKSSFKTLEPVSSDPPQSLCRNFIANLPGTGPPFDHTLFSPLGNYLYINSKEQEAGEIAWLVTPYVETVQAQDKCTVRFFYHMHGSGVGKLTLYIQ